MVIVSVIVTALLLLGFFLLSDLEIGFFKDKLIETRDYGVKTYEEIQQKKKLTLKAQVDIMQGKKKENFIAASFSEAKNILTQSGREKGIRTVNIVSAVLGGIGFFVSIFLFENIFMAPSLTIGLLLLPSWLLRISENSLQKHLNSELEIALSTITTSYVRNDNFVQAVEENIKYLNAPVKQVFQRFVSEYKYVNSNVIYGINKMKTSLDSAVFHEWCNAIIQCQDDRTLKVTLFPIVNKFSEIKSIQEELDTLLMMPMRDFIMVSLIVIASIPMMQFLNKEWYYGLLNSVPGKIILSLVSLCFFYGLDKAIKLSKPLEYTR